jgi:hypothetical protein
VRLEVAVSTPRIIDTRFLMNHWNKSAASWGTEDSFGASVMVALLASIGLSLWPGWPAIHAWLLLPFAAMIGWS